MNFMVALAAVVAVLCWTGVQAATPFACANCDDITPRMNEFCQKVVGQGQPCSSYKLVWRRLCRRTCLAVNRMNCADQLQVCNEDPDCPLLCKMFFDQLCPPTMDASALNADNPAHKKAGAFLQVAGVLQSPVHWSSWGKNKWKRRQRFREQFGQAKQQKQKKKKVKQDSPIVQVIQYTVKKGDWLSKLARTFSTTVELIVRANPIIKNPDLIFPGQVLNIPIPGNSAEGPQDPCPGTPLY